MSDQSREELNAIAAAAGVADPDQLPNKQAVLDAIAAHEAPPEPRVFQLRDAAGVDEEGIHRVSLGGNPRVSLGPGETFSTTNPKLARRLAASEHLEEVTS
jgi:hypothetical protein